MMLTPLYLITNQSEEYPQADHKHSNPLPHPVFNIYFYFLFIWLWWVSVVACGFFSCGMWDLVSWPPNEPRPPDWEHRVLATGPPGKSLHPVFKSLSLKAITEFRFYEHWVPWTLCKGPARGFTAWRWFLSGCFGGRCHRNSIGTCKREHTLG